MTISKGNMHARALVNQQAHRCLQLTFNAIISAKNHETLEELQKEFVRLNTMGAIGSALDQMETTGILNVEISRD